jgi:G:T/U-mismatch repair DNA glycosylase
VRTLPDLLQPARDLVFVGINPGEQPACAARHDFPHGNGFWSAFTALPLVECPLTPEDDRSLSLTDRIDLTDIVKQVIVGGDISTVGELRVLASAFRRCIAYDLPRAVCFTSIGAFNLLFPKIRARNGWGCQSVTIEGAQIWVMSSTSDRTMLHRDHVQRVLQELTAAIAIDRTVAA